MRLMNVSWVRCIDALEKRCLEKTQKITLSLLSTPRVPCCPVSDEQGSFENPPSSVLVHL